MKRLIIIFVILLGRQTYAQERITTGIEAIDKKIEEFGILGIFGDNTTTISKRVSILSEILAMMEEYNISDAKYYSILEQRARAYHILERYSKSLEDLKKLYEYYIIIDDYNGISNICKLLSDIYIEFEEYDKSVLYAEKSYDAALILNDRNIIINSLCYLLDAYFYNNDVAKCAYVGYELDKICYNDPLYLDISYFNIMTMIEIQEYNIELAIKKLSGLEIIANTNYDKARIAQALADYYKDNMDQENTVLYLSKVVDYFHQENDYIEKEAEKYHYIINGTTTLLPIYANAIFELCKIYIANNLYDNAYEYIKMILIFFEDSHNGQSTYRRMEYENNLNYYLPALIYSIPILTNKTQICKDGGISNEKLETDSNIAKYCEVLKKCITESIDQLPYMTLEERQRYIEKYYAYIDATTALHTFFEHITNLTPDYLTTTLYDIILSLKGLLLYVERNIGENYIDDRIEYAIKIPSTAELSDALKLSTSVAIEFIDYYDDEEKQYAALILRKDWDAPKMVGLCDEQELAQIYKQQYQAYSEEWSKKLYNLIWSKLEPYINEGDDIYFSPSGLLHQINIEVLQDENGRLANEKYNLHRLSSTRELCIERPKTEYSSAVLYGGLKYDMNSNELLAQSRAYSRKDGYTATRGFITDSTSRGINLSYLKGTKNEVLQIENYLHKNNISATSYIAQAGTEESFKALSGKKTPIIHLATHGFFYTNEEAQKKSYFEMLTANQTSVRPDNSLKRSGLILAGAQLAWDGKEIPDSVEDGILLAEEIATMDLSGTALVVLSACETGLGEITSEGVFGLQRAFKRAGVQTLIMSLWKVDDEATQLMMATFYKEWLSGKSKHEAFAIAQQTVRSNKDYQNPFYWASFIMLD